MGGEKGPVMKAAGVWTSAKGGEKGPGMANAAGVWMLCEGVVSPPPWPPRLPCRPTRTDLPGCCHTAGRCGRTFQEGMGPGG